ncbi:MAG: hypothetical protein WDN75_11770 [Bacteroidota bacterium]
MRGENETAIRSFFSELVVRFLENREEIHIECHKHRLLIYKKLDLLDPHEIEFLEMYSEDFVKLLAQRLEQPVAQ